MGYKSFYQSPTIHTNTYTGAGSIYVVHCQYNGYYYYLCAGGTTPTYVLLLRSIDGISVTAQWIVKSANCTQFALWYDRWSGINDDKIHLVYTNSSTGDVLYRNFTPSTEAFSTEYTVFNGSSTASGGCLSIVRTRGGNLIVAGCIDAGTESFCYRSVDVGVNWTSRAAVMEGETQDQLILLPGWAADNQDAMAIFWDASADEISRKVYDDSADSWAETSIAGSMIDQVATTAFPHFNATVDITNSQNLLVAWSAIDTLNADLRCWKVTESSITEVTNVVLNSVDDQGLCGIGIDANNYWYVWYCGKSDGSEAFTSAVGCYMKISKDGGSTWSSEINVSTINDDIRSLRCTPRFVKWSIFKHYSSYLYLDTELTIPKASHLIGI